MTIQNQEIATLVCSQCQATNRVPVLRLGDRPICGKCKNELLPTRPVSLTDESFSRFISRTSLPILVDFWAPWCGPCKMMAPAFEEASRILSPYIVLAKVDTETAPSLSLELRIQSIPTLILFDRGVEKVRQSGAMSTKQLVDWTRAQSVHSRR